MSRQRVVLPETREALLNLFPAAFENSDHLRLLEHLLFSTFEDEDDSEFVVIDAFTLARFQGKENAQRSRNYRGLDLLSAFQRDVMALDVQDYRYGEGKARMVRRPKIPTLGKALQKEFISSREERRRRGVYLLTGERPPQRPARKDVASQKQAEQEQIESIARSVPADHPAAAWLNFLNTQPAVALRRIFDRNLEAARQLALDSLTLSVPAKTYNLRLLHDIEESAKPLYRPSPENKTVRLFPVGNTYLSLSREVRKRLLAGCDEFDLAAAQLTLAAHVWKVPSLQEQVIQDKILGPWGMLARRAGLPIKSKDQPIPQKPAIKKATYTLLFGGGPKRVKETLLNPQAGQPLTQAQATQFMESDVVQDIIRAQKARQEQYIKDGGFEDAFGRWVALEADGKRRDVKSLMAQELQSYELFILKPGLDYLIELGTDKVTVMAWQHDGLTLHFKDATKADRYIREMGKRITRQAIYGVGIKRWQFALEGVKL